MLNRLVVDTHAHICDSAFDADRSEVLQKAKEIGVGAIIAVGEDLSDAQRNIQLAETYAILRPAAGLYPTILDPEKAKGIHLKSSDLSFPGASSLHNTLLNLTD